MSDFFKSMGSLTTQKAARYVKNEIDEYVSGYNSIADDYNKSIVRSDSSYDSNYKTSYSRLSNSVAENKSRAQRLLSDLNRYREVLGDDYYSSAKSNLQQIAGDYDTMSSQLENYNSYWSQFNDKDEYYNYHFSQKYADSTIDDIDAEIGRFNASADSLSEYDDYNKQWLNNNRVSFLSDNQLASEIQQMKEENKDATKKSMWSILDVIGDALYAGAKGISGTGITSEDSLKAKTDINTAFDNASESAKRSSEYATYNNELQKRYAKIINSHDELKTDLENYDFYLGLRNSNSMNSEAISASANANEIREKWIADGYDFDALYDTFKSESTQEIMQGVSEFSAEHPILSTVGSFVMTPLKGLGTIESVASVLTGNDIDTNSAAYYPSLISSTIRDTVQNTFKEDERFKFLFKDVNVDLGSLNVSFNGYDILVSALDSALNAALGKVAGIGVAELTGGNVKKIVSGITSSIMGSEVASDAVISGKEKGYSDEKAVALGLIQACIEGVTEKYSIEAILNNPVSILGTAAKSFVAEGSEEFTSNMINRLVDIIANGDQSDILSTYYEYIELGKSQSEASLLAFYDALGEDVSSFIAGGISGMSMGAVETGSTFSDTYKTGRTVNQNQSTQNLINDASALSESIKTSKAQKLYDKSTYSNEIINTPEGAESDTKNKISLGQKITNARSNLATGKLYNAVQDTLRNKSSESIRAAVNERLIEEGMSAGEAAEMTQLIVKITSGEDISRSERKTVKKNSIASKVLNELDEAYAQLYFEQFGLDMELGQNSDWAKGAVSDFMQKAEKLNEYAESKSVESETKQEPETETRAIVDTEAEEKKIYGESGEKTLESLVENSDEGTETTIRELFDEYYNAGVLSSRDVEDVNQTVNDSVLTREFSKQIKKYALAAGIVDYESSKTNPNSAVRKGGVVNRERAVGELNVNSSAVDILDAVSKKIGVNVQINPTLEVAGGNPRGKYYDGTIYLAADKLTEGRELMTVFAHELGHHLEKIAPEQYRNFKRFVIENIKKNPGRYAEILGNMKLTYRQVNANMLDMEIMDEIVADSMELFFFDTQFVAEAIEHDRSFVEKVLDAIKKFLEEIKESIREFASNDSARTLNYILKQQNEFEHGVELVESMLNEGRATVEKSALTTEDSEDVQKNANASVTEKSDNVKKNSPKYSFAGVDAANADISKLYKAMLLERAGYDNESLRAITGWFRGREDRWKFEIDDSKMEFNRHGFFSNPDVNRYWELSDKLIYDDTMSEDEFSELRALSKTLDGVKKHPKYLKDYIKHDELFKAYPQLGDIKMFFEELPTNEGGYYDPNDNTIHMNRDVRDTQSIKKTLIHEIQHAIQNIEGFAGGASHDFWTHVQNSDRAYWSPDGRLYAPKFLYKNTAGEIEARDAANRLDYDNDDKMAIPVDLGGDTVVFSEEVELDSVDDDYDFGESKDTQAVEEYLKSQKKEKFSLSSDSESAERMEYVGEIDSDNGLSSEAKVYAERMTEQLHDILKGKSLSRKAIEEIASSVISRYGSNMAKSDLADKLELIVEYISAYKDSGDYNTNHILATCQSIAKQIVEKSTMRDDELHEQYKDLRKDIMRRKFYVSRFDVSTEDIRQIASLANRRFYITTDPNQRSAKVRDIDDYYDELHNNAPEFFPETSSPTEQLSNIAAFLDVTTVRVKNIYDSGEMGMGSDEAARILGGELYYTFAKAINELHGTRESIKMAGLYYDSFKNLMNQSVSQNARFIEYAKQKDTEAAKYRELAYRKIEEKKAELKAGAERRQVIEQLKKLYSSSLKLLNGSRADKMGVQSENKKSFLNVLELVNFINEDFPDSKLNFKYADIRNRLVDMRMRLEDIQKNSKSNGNDVVDDEVIEYIKSLEYITDNGQKSISQLTTEELKMLKSAIEHFKGIIINSNKMFSEELDRTRDEYGQAIINELLSTADRKSIAYGTKLQKVHTALETNQMMPIYFFENMGGTLDKLWVNVMKTEGKQSDILEGAVKTANGIMNKFNFGKWAFDTPAMEVTLGGRTVQIELMEALSIYAIAKREKGNKNRLSETSHLLNGGITIKNSESSLFKKLKERIKSKKDPLSNNPIQNVAVKVTEANINNICAKLTEEQKQFADAMVEYLSKDLAAVGNEASRKMYNYDIFTESYYFPMSVDENYLASSPDKGQTKQVKNSSFTKHITLGSNAPVQIRNFMDVWIDHVSGMSVYAATAPALNDFMRVYNYKNEANTVKGLIADRYGEDFNDYIMKLIEDLNGGYRTDSTGELSDTLIRNMKTAAVSLSLTCAIQQPSAIGRAYAYLGVSKTRGPSVQGYNEMMEHSALARIKNSAGYDTMSGTSLMYDMMYGDSTVAEKTKLFFENLKHKETRSLSREQLSEFGFLLPGFMDSMTWSAIWNMSKAQIRSQNKYKYESEEFFGAVTELFEGVIRHTQVYDTTFQRSGNLRSTNALVKTEMAFMSEPTVTMNMLMSTRNDIKNGDKKTAARKIGSVILGMALNTLLKSLMTAFYKYDDDKKWYENYGEDIISNFTSDVGSMVPYVKDIVSMLEGYDVERMDLTNISRLINAWNQITSDDKTPVQKISNIAGYLADIFGVPGTTIKKNIYALYNNIISVGADAGVPYEEMINAVMNGDSDKLSEMYDDLIAAGYKKSTIENGYREAMTNIPEVQEAAEYLLNNDESNYYSVCRELMDMGFDHSDIKAAVKIAMENIQEEKTNPVVGFFNELLNKSDDEIEVPDYSNPAFEEMVTAVLDGDKSSFTDMYNQLYADGYTESGIQSGYRNVMADTIPEVEEAAQAYIDGNMGAYSIKVGEIAKMGFTLADSKAAVNIVIKSFEEAKSDGEKFADSRISDIGSDINSSPTKTSEDELFDGVAYDYDMLYNVLTEQGSSGTDYKEIYQYLVDSGKKKSKIEEAMENRAEKTVKAYINAEISSDTETCDSCLKQLANFYGSETKAQNAISKQRQTVNDIIKKYLNASGDKKTEYGNELKDEFGSWDEACKAIEYYKNIH